MRIFYKFLAVYTNVSLLKNVDFIYRKVDKCSINFDATNVYNVYGTGRR